MNSQANIQVRRLTQPDEFRDCVSLQRKIWGFSDPDLLPREFFGLAGTVGGQVLGAFVEARMAGFCLAIPGLGSRGELYLHGHMLGVLSEYRDLGLARMMKLGQRSDALSQGIELIEWTFDPLQIKNAYFNIERLGVIIRQYLPNEYGRTSSRLHGGLPTDRLRAEWWIKTPRVSTTIEAGSVERAPTLARVTVPTQILDVRSQDTERAGEIQKCIGEEFKKYFAAGLAVIGFEKTETGGTYLLGQWESTGSTQFFSR